MQQVPAGVCWLTLLVSFAINYSTQSAIPPAFGLKEAYQNALGNSERIAFEEGNQELEAQTRLTLYASVAHSYFSVLAAQKDIEDLKVLLDLTGKRVTELQCGAHASRPRRGKSLQAQAATWQAQLRVAGATLSRAREQLAYLTGLSRDAVLKDKEFLPPALPAKELFLILSEKRPDLESLKLQLDAANENIQVAQPSLYPWLDLAGATDIQKQKRLQLQRAARSVRKQIETLYQSISNILAQRRALAEAAEVSLQNYRQQTHDFSFGLVPHIDVLMALSTFQENKRQLDKTRYDILTNLAALHAAAAQIP